MRQRPFARASSFSPVPPRPQYSSKVLAHHNGPDPNFNLGTLRNFQRKSKSPGNIPSNTDRGSYLAGRDQRSLRAGKKFSFNDQGGYVQGNGPSQNTWGRREVRDRESRVLRNANQGETKPFVNMNYNVIVNGNQMINPRFSFEPMQPGSSENGRGYSGTQGKNLETQGNRGQPPGSLWGGKARTRQPHPSRPYAKSERDFYLNRPSQNPDKFLRSMVNDKQRKSDEIISQNIQNSLSSKRIPPTFQANVSHRQSSLDPYTPQVGRQSQTQGNQGGHFSYKKTRAKSWNNVHFEKNMHNYDNNNQQQPRAMSHQFKEDMSSPKYAKSRHSNPGESDGIMVKNFFSNQGASQRNWQTSDLSIVRTSGDSGSSFGSFPTPKSTGISGPGIRPDLRRQTRPVHRNFKKNKGAVASEIKANRGINKNQSMPLELKKGSRDSLWEKRHKSVKSHKQRGVSRRSNEQRLKSIDNFIKNKYKNHGMELTYKKGSVSGNVSSLDQKPNRNIIGEFVPKRSKDVDPEFMRLMERQVEPVMKLGDMQKEVPEQGRHVLNVLRTLQEDDKEQEKKKPIPPRRESNRYDQPQISGNQSIQSHRQFKADQDYRTPYPTTHYNPQMQPPHLNNPAPTEEPQTTPNLFKEEPVDTSSNYQTNQSGHLGYSLSHSETVHSSRDRIQQYMEQELKRMTGDLMAPLPAEGQCNETSIHRYHNISIDPFNPANAMLPRRPGFQNQKPVESDEPEVQRKEKLRGQKLDIQDSLIGIGNNLDNILKSLSNLGQLAQSCRSSVRESNREIGLHGSQGSKLQREEDVADRLYQSSNQRTDFESPFASNQNNQNFTKLNRLLSTRYPEKQEEPAEFTADYGQFDPELGYPAETEEAAPYDPRMNNPFLKNSKETHTQQVSQDIPSEMKKYSMIQENNQTHFFSPNRRPSALKHLTQNSSSAFRNSKQRFKSEMHVRDPRRSNSNIVHNDREYLYELKDLSAGEKRKNVFDSDFDGKSGSVSFEKQLDRKYFKTAEPASKKRTKVRKKSAPKKSVKTKKKKKPQLKKVKKVKKVTRYKILKDGTRVKKSEYIQTKKGDKTEKKILKKETLPRDGKPLLPEKKRKKVKKSRTVASGVFDKGKPKRKSTSISKPKVKKPLTLNFIKNSTANNARNRKPTKRQIPSVTSINDKKQGKSLNTKKPMKAKAKTEKSIPKTPKQKSKKKKPRRASSTKKKSLADSRISQVDPKMFRTTVKEAVADPKIEKFFSTRQNLKRYKQASGKKKTKGKSPKTEKRSSSLWKQLSKKLDSEIRESKTPKTKKKKEVKLNFQKKKKGARRLNEANTKKKGKPELTKKKPYKKKISAVEQIKSALSKQDNRAVTQEDNVVNFSRDREFSLMSVQKINSTIKDSVRTERSYEKNLPPMILSRSNNLEGDLMSPEHNRPETFKKKESLRETEKDKKSENSFIYNDKPETLENHELQAKATEKNQRQAREKPKPVDNLRKDSRSDSRDRESKHRRAQTFGSTNDFEESFIITNKVGEEEIKHEIIEMELNRKLLDGPGFFYLNSKDLEVYKIQDLTKKRNPSDQLMNDIRDFSSKVIEDSKNLLLHFCFFEKSRNEFLL